MQTLKINYRIYHLAGFDHAPNVEEMPAKARAIIAGRESAPFLRAYRGEGRMQV